MTPTLTDDEIMTALRAFLLAVLPSGVEVVQGQDNRVAEPLGPDHVIMTPARREQLSSTTHDYDPAHDTAAIARSTGLHFQLDTYGPNASDNVQVISTLFRDAYGASFLKTYGVAPLYCDDGQQMPLVNGESQYEQRWMMRGVLQASIAVNVPTEFADNLITTLVEVS